MKQVDVVIGLNYGDEGKGAAVDWLCHGAVSGDRNCGDYYEAGSAAVVRFNGGAQAGHTVVTPDGRRHVFSQFGSGTFAGCPTILSRFMMVNPIMFWKERKELLGKVDKLPPVYVDPRAYVTTPYDVFINQELERSRGNDRHGSCGMGIGETEVRSDSGFALWAVDLWNYDHLEHHILNIERLWLPERLEQLRLDPDLSILESAKDRFLQDARYFIENTECRDDTVMMSGFDYIVMEGAQGMRLDRHSRDFPHVTRSNTNSKNITQLLPKYLPIHMIDYDVPELNFWYVTRSHLTRHGAGPLDGEINNPGFVDETNQNNEFQGALRYAPLDFKRIEYEVMNDQIRWPHEHAEVRGIMSHMDQILPGQNADELVGNFQEALGTTLIAEFNNPCWRLD